MRVKKVKKYALAYAKSFCVLFATAFILSVIFKGIGFIVLEYIEADSSTFNILTLIATLVTIAVSFFYSAYTIARDVSTGNSYVLPTIFSALMITSFAVNNVAPKELYSYFDKSVYFIFAFLFSYGFSYIGAKSGSSLRGDKNVRSQHLTK